MPALLWVLFCGARRRTPPRPPTQLAAARARRTALHHALGRPRVTQRGPDERTGLSSRASENRGVCWGCAGRPKESAPPGRASRLPSHLGVAQRHAHRRGALCPPPQARCGHHHCRCRRQRRGRRAAGWHGGVRRGRADGRRGGGRGGRKGSGRGVVRHDRLGWHPPLPRLRSPRRRRFSSAVSSRGLGSSSPSPPAAPASPPPPSSSLARKNCASASSSSSKKSSLALRLRPAVAGRLRAPPLGRAMPLLPPPA